MRWSNLLVDEEAARRLPGYADPAVVRTFDAPEAMNVRFYEVQAKSALNRVPKASRMPFTWTINPYRGCTHACEFCGLGETPVLAADGRWTPLAALRRGDGIYGTTFDGKYHRYTRTTVLDHWETRKRAYRVELEDGTELVVSEDHRLLTAQRGWKYVTGTEQGRARRPHLTINNELLGTGKFAAQPAETRPYQLGYLAGMIRGDGCITERVVGSGWAAKVSGASRLALADYEALLRTERYLRSEGIGTHERVFSRAAGNHRAMHAISTGGSWPLASIKDRIRWPWQPVQDWFKGFLAGIFDAEGSCSQGVLRICNTDPGILEMTERALNALGFDSVVEDPARENGIKYVRLRGGLRERLRFFHTVDPAIPRKRSIEGVALKSDTRLRVVAIEDLGMTLPMYDITTGTGDYISDGVVSHNCFARPTHTFLDMNAREDFEREIVVKVNAPEVLRVELRRPSWKREHVALGTNTDPYQWVESRYRLMPEIWKALLDSRTPCSVLTKSPLLLRDKELFVELAREVGFTANLSIPTLDEKAWRATEPHTPSPRARIEAVAELNRLGVPTGVLVAPLIPGVNDDPEQVAEIVRLCAEAGAKSIGGIGLHLRGEVRDIWFDWLREHRPDLLPRYEELYARGAYLPASEKERLAKLVKPTTAEFTRRRGRLTPGGDAAERDPSPPPRTGHEAALRGRRGRGGEDGVGPRGKGRRNGEDTEERAAPAQQALF